MLGVHHPLTEGLALRIVCGYLDLYGSELVRDEALHLVEKVWTGGAPRTRGTLLSLLLAYEELAGEPHPVDALLPM